LFVLFSKRSFVGSVQLIFNSIECFDFQSGALWDQCS
jgi:hypothetical protein